MKKSILTVSIVIILAIILLMVFPQKKQEETKQILEMEITSSAFTNNGNIPEKYTCNGDNLNPPLKILGIPEGAQQLVLIMDDPDALPVAGKVWDHWILFNIKPISSIAENSVPQGAVQGKNGAGNNEYQGPCPPAGAPHHYRFKLYALETSSFLLKEGASKSEVEAAMKSHILAQAELVGLYTKP